MNVTFEIGKKLKDAGINLFDSKDIYIGNNNPYINGICNKVEGVFVEDFERYRWSSYISTEDIVFAPTIDEVLKYFRDQSMYNIIATHYWHKSEMCWQYTIYDLGFPPSTIIISETNGKYVDWEDAIMGAIDTVLNELLTKKD